jgi:hypothetical protein
MRGTMMDFPLTLAPVLERADNLFGQVEVVSRRPDRAITRSRYGDLYLVLDRAPVVRLCLLHGSTRVHAGSAAGKGARENLCPVACVDVDVFAGEVAGPNACGTWARVQIHNDRDVFREHLLVSDVFIEGMFASAAAYLDAG